jgi:hypothetical protein
MIPPVTKETMREASVALDIHLSTPQSHHSRAPRVNSQPLAVTSASSSMRMPMFQNCLGAFGGAHVQAGLDRQDHAGAGCAAVFMTGWPCVFFARGWLRARLVAAIVHVHAIQKWPVRWHVELAVRAAGNVVHGTVFGGVEANTSVPWASTRVAASCRSVKRCRAW